jgi:WD40 repeat protein
LQKAVCYVARERQTFEGHGDWIDSALFSSDSRKILTTSGDVTAKLWDAKSGSLIHTFKGPDHFVESAVFSLNGL